MWGKLDLACSHQTSVDKIGDLECSIKIVLSPKGPVSTSVGLLFRPKQLSKFIAEPELAIIVVLINMS